MHRKPLPLLIVVLLISTGGVLLFFARVTVLQLRNIDRQGLAKIRVAQAERFSMFYVHSIYQAQVAEEFEVNKDRIVLKGVRTGSPGVMEYYGFESVKDFHPLDRTVATPFVIKRAMGRGQGFQFMERTLYLHQIARKGDRVQVSLVPVSWAAYLMAELLKSPLAITVE